MSLPRLLCLSAGLALLPAAAISSPALLHDFRDITRWAANLDGGHAPALSAARPAGMTLTYRDSDPHWGNLVGPCRVPPNATALRVRFTKRRSSPSAAMHIWLQEPDGDAWLQPLTVSGTPIGGLAAGSYVADLPVASFSFERRGPGTRKMTSVDHMLIGCNYGDLEVTMTGMEWQLADAAGTAPLPVTPGLRPTRTARGSIGVLDMGPGLPGGFESAHSPAKLATALRMLGYGVTMLKPGDLANPATLTRPAFDAVVITSGPYFPAAARPAFLAYLKAGGRFLSTDGYAFDSLVSPHEGGWAVATCTAEQVASPPAALAPMNTRTGQAGDAMTFQLDQVGMFDPQFQLDDVSRMEPLPGWGPAVLPVTRPVTGYAACVLLGANSPVFPDVYRRWRPVVMTYDALGRPRGAALALAYNTGGPFKGSVWAFSGLTSGHDLLLGTPERARLLDRVMRELVGTVVVTDLRTDLACYRPGETVHARATLTNYGAAPATVQATWLSRSGKRAVAVRLSAGETRTVGLEAPAGSAASGIAKVLFTIDPPGMLPDTVETAYVVGAPGKAWTGPTVEWRENYMHWNGKPTFLTGTNQTGMMFYSAHESPDVWESDFRSMAAHNIRVVRILHFSPFAARGFEGQSAHAPADLRNRPEALCRKLDAIVHLAGKHGVAIFLAVHDWLDVALTDQELADEADWNRFWAGRYRDCPWVFFDVQNEPAVDMPERPDILALWNRWLATRYGSDQGLREAWGEHAPAAQMPNVPMPGASNDWSNVPAADRKRFEAVLLNRWVKANVDGIKAGNPKAPVTVGYLPSMPPADKMLGTDHVDFANMHYYGPIEGYPLEHKLTDRRFSGKGFSLGEFGSQEAHDARNYGSATVPHEASEQRFRTILHYAAGMGAAFVANWCWKEFDEAVFPWGLVQRGTGTPRPWLATYAQGSLFLSQVHPVYRSPEVFILAPDRNRVGPRLDSIHGGLQRAVELLLEQRVNFGVINEESLASLPASVRALLWPTPYCPDDATFARVLEWTRGGGHLYLSGDVQFGADRKAGRSARLAELGLPDMEPRSPFETPEARWSRPVVAHALGKGSVTFVPYPLELRRREGDAAVYGGLLDRAGVERVAVKSGVALRAQSIPCEGGLNLTMVARPGVIGPPDPVGLPGLGVQLSLAPGESALVVSDASGRVVGAEYPREMQVRGRAMPSGKGQLGVIALDGKPLAVSASVLLLPHANRQLDLSGLSARLCACRTARGKASRPAGEWTVAFPADAWAVLGRSQYTALSAYKRFGDALAAGK